MLKLKSISPSRIKTFDTCKFKYWLTYHCDDVKLRSNWGAAHGTLLHDILEQVCVGEDADWVSRLYRGYGGKLETKDKFGKDIVMDSPLIWAKPADFKDKKPWCDTCPYATEELCSISQQRLDALTGCPRDLFDTSVSTLQKVIGRYEQPWSKILKDVRGVPIGAEYSLHVKVKGTEIPMIGYMDLVIEEDPETLHIIDYKAGKSTQTYEECRLDIQAMMYSWAARREFIDDVNNKGFKYKNIILTFDYFTNHPITLAFTAQEDAETEKFVAAKVAEIQNTDWITRIVRSNDDFKSRSAWKCNALCDPGVCANKWKGRFQAI